MLTQDQFDRARRLAAQLAGIELFERHREVLHRRGCRIAGAVAGGVAALLSAVERGDPAAGRQFVELITTKFTGFFRHPQQFEVVAEHARLAAQRRGAARIWSAGAATGEEPYSVAMTLIEVFQRENPLATILATDIDEGSLAKARQGDYRAAALSEMNLNRRERFFTASDRAGRWRIAESVRRLVDFQSLNLVDPVWPMEGSFDVILCRNVLMYLSASHRHAVAERLAAVLAPGGVLILDPAEHLGPAEPLFDRGVGGVYPARASSPHPRVAVLG